MCASGDENCMTYIACSFDNECIAKVLCGETDQECIDATVAAGNARRLKASK